MSMVPEVFLPYFFCACAILWTPLRCPWCYIIYWCCFFMDSNSTQEHRPVETMCWCLLGHHGVSGLRCYDKLNKNSPYAHFLTGSGGLNKHLSKLWRLERRRGSRCWSILFDCHFWAHSLWDWGLPMKSRFKTRFKHEAFIPISRSGGH